MAEKKNRLESSGLEFFGRISASISHEINNILAIINEEAGILEDLLLMAEKGAPLPPARLNRVATAVRKQIQRANKIVKQMNTFAHSAGDSIVSVNLYDATVFITNICERIFSSKRVSLCVIPPVNTVSVKSSRYYLQNMIFLFLEAFLEGSDSATTVQIEFIKTGKGAEIRFLYAGTMVNVFSEILNKKSKSELIAYLKAQVVFDFKSNEFKIQLPERIR
jgi:C4-dicarboxylate-specific signal transduction histidine kinase